VLERNVLTDIVRREELVQAIATDVVSEWVSSLILRYHESRAAKKFLRLKRGISQELLEELLPLAKYSKAFYNCPDIFLKYYPGTENSFDAEFIDGKGNLIERVEVTLSIDGYQSILQAEALNEFGHAPIYETPEFNGNAKNRELKEPIVSLISTETIIQTESEKLQRAYLKKHKNIHKYPNVTLLIGIDLPLLLSWEYKRIIEPFQVLENTFNSIKCVNLSSNHYWCFK
jgi:hypothetical protein